MCFGHAPLEVALALLEDGISEEDLPSAMAAHSPLGGLQDMELPFAVAE